MDGNRVDRFSNLTLVLGQMSFPCLDFTSSSFKSAVMYLADLDLVACPVGEGHSRTGISLRRRMSLQ